ncbi:MAG: DUF177 domain-containing protein [Alphaproteobacteria bacterium]|nr:DUF177 domain-containing protein [Alphaproteobacteria bacterium]
MINPSAAGMLNEMPRPQRVDGISAAGVTIDIAATTAECAAIALRLGVPGLKSLTARFRLHARGDGVISAAATLSARLVRECVVSLEAFEVTQRETFPLRFVPAGSESPDPDPESEDEIPYSGGTIDLGEAAVEQLALDLDPYPRKDGATLPDEAASAPESPFAAILKLRRDG